MITFQEMAFRSLRKLLLSCRKYKRTEEGFIVVSPFLVNVLRKGGQRPIIRCCLEQVVNSFDGPELFQRRTPSSLSLSLSLSPLPPSLFLSLSPSTPPPPSFIPSYCYLTG